MRALTQEERDALDLGDATLEEEGVARGPPSGVALGLAATPAVPLERLVAERPVFAAEDAFGPRLAAAGVRLWRHDLSPDVFALEASDLARVKLAGTVLKREDRVYVDARLKAAVARIHASTSDIVLDFQGPDVRLLRMVVSAARVGRPELRELAAGYTLAPWLRAVVEERLGRGDPLGFAMAAGLIARLWTPETREELVRAKGQLLDPNAGPTAAALAWWKRIDGTVQEAIARSAEENAARLRAAFDELREAVITGRGTRAGALEWLHGRDDLESVLYLLATTTPQPPLARMLRDLDDAAALHHAIWLELRLWDDPRLRAVAWQEPDAWWGRLAAGD